MSSWDRNQVTVEEEITNEFAKLAPWIFQFRIRGADYGGAISARGDIRLEQFFRFAPGVQSIIELGALEGAQTSVLAQHPGVKRVTAIEGRKTNLRKARLVQDYLRMDNVEFTEANLESADLTVYGTFDAVFCCGLLYHLPEPWKLLQQLPAVAPILFLWTVYAPENEAQPLPNGMQGRLHMEGGPDEPLSGLSPTATWLTLECLLALLNTYGYEHVEVIDNNPTDVNGPTVSIGARRARSA